MSAVVFAGRFVRTVIRKTFLLTETTETFPRETPKQVRHLTSKEVMALGFNRSMSQILTKKFPVEYIVDGHYKQEQCIPVFLWLKEQKPFQSVYWYRWEYCEPKSFPSTFTVPALHTDSQKVVIHTFSDKTSKIVSSGCLFGIRILKKRKTSRHE